MRRISPVFALVMLIASPALASEYLPEGELAEDSPYAQGKVRIGLGGGSQSSGNTWNFGLALSLGYFVIDNLEVGVDTAIQFGDDPFAAQLGPTVRMLFPVDESVHPYVGAFYRHWFLAAGFADVDTVGLRAGLIVRTGPTFFGLGAVFETIVSECDTSCTSFYPELGLSVLF